MKVAFTITQHYVSLWLVSFLLLVVSTTAFAQTPNVIYPKPNGTVSASPASAFTQRSSITSAQLRDFALFTPPSISVLNINLSLATTSTIRIPLKSIASPGSRAGVLIGRNSSFLTTNLLSGARLRTYLGSALQEERIVSAALLSAVLGSGSQAPVQWEFLSTKQYDAVELEISIPAEVSLGPGTGLRIYYAYAADQNVLNEANGYLSRFANPSASNYDLGYYDTQGLLVCVNTRAASILNAVDQNLDNYTTLHSLATVNCPTTLRLQLEGTAPATYRAGFLVSYAGLLDVNALSSLTLTTYLDGIPQETAAGASLVQATLLPGLTAEGNNRYYLSFATTKKFNAVEIRQNALLGVLEGLNVYYGFGIEEAAFRGRMPIFSNFASPARGTEYRTFSNAVLCVDVCVGCTPAPDCAGIQNPGSAADGQLGSSFASISETLSGLSKRSIRLRLNKINGTGGDAGNRVGVVVGLNQGLLSADVLANVTVATYSANGNTLLESATGQALTTASLLNGSRQELFFYATQDFDWVEFTMQGGVSLLEETKIYYAFAEDQTLGSATAIVPFDPLPVTLLSFTGQADEGGIALQWATASETDNSHFVVERMVEMGQGFKAIGSVTGTGTTLVPSHYYFVDKEASYLSAMVFYYRLRQVDYDGAEELTKTIAVERSKTSVSNNLILYPNPVQKPARFSTSLTGAHTVVLYDTGGRVLSVQKAKEAQNATFHTEGLVAGLYLVQIQGPQGEILSRQKLVIQE